MMKALILAAGFGTRLRPWTEHTPKPLFSINGRCLLDRLILQLKDAGCNAVAVNTHHLSDKIEAHVVSRSYGIPIFTRYEPHILGTGGAIKNLSDFWDDRPFLVVNADIFTDIDFRTVFNFHFSNNAPATLVLMDAPPLNSVSVDTEGCISRFFSKSQILSTPIETYTFTGIQVLEPRILSMIPDNVFYSSIDVFKRLIADGTPPKAYIDTSRKWQDLGSPDRYKTTVRNEMAATAFQKAFGRVPSPPIEWTLLAGDGSDRIWYRIRDTNHSMVAADHGIRKETKPVSTEIESFVSIGQHLLRKGLPIPRIYRYDLFSGWVFMEDVGDTHLQAVVMGENSPDAQQARYRPILDLLIRFSTAGIDGFDPSWTCQSTAYDRALILERECGYFVNAFLCGYMGLDVTFDEFASDFERLSEGALSGAFTGLMHRDFQSRNIMIQQDEPRIIDFQGARIGPIQYDLASLLIDPYVGLSEKMQNALFDYTASRLLETQQFDPLEFRRCFDFCRITRNLQMLGAFGYLCRVKRKRQFEQYIPAALDTLKKSLSIFDLPGISPLKKTVDNLKL